MILSAMNYDTLKSLGEEYLGDASEEGVTKSNMFNEYMGNTGTVASAMVIKDFIMQKKFNNDRDGGRVLTSMPFSIRRPSKQLVEEYEKLLNWQGILNLFQFMENDLFFFKNWYATTLQK